VIDPDEVIKQEGWWFSVSGENMRKALEDKEDDPVGREK